ncbi:MAG: hypothetical protein AAFP84_22910, partial [Actinomycetota bacterium]
MTTVRDWIDANPQRRAPEFDFGTHWTREHDPDTEWALTYNCGTGELYTRTRSGDDVEVLGRFADPEHVGDALPDWARRSMQPGSLDWARRTLDRPAPGPREVDQAPVYGVVLTTDGRATALREPPSIDDIANRIDGPLSVSSVSTGDPSDRVVMFVDDEGHNQQLPVNAAATRLYGTGWPIVGDTVVVTDDNRPLPPVLTDRLLKEPGHAEPEPGPWSVALEWEDHHRDRELVDRALG